MDCLNNAAFDNNLSNYISTLVSLGGAAIMGTGAYLSLLPFTFLYKSQREDQEIILRQNFVKTIDDYVARNL